MRLLKRFLKALSMYLICTVMTIALISSLFSLFPATAQEVTYIASRLAFRATTSYIAYPSVLRFQDAAGKNAIQVDQLVNTAALLEFPAATGTIVAPGDTTAITNAGYILIKIGATAYKIPVLQNE